MLRLARWISAVAVFELSRDPGDLVFRAGTDSYGGAGVTQRQGDGPADTSARPGDKRNLCIETKR
jgi:hypothetical protein